PPSSQSSPGSTTPLPQLGGSQPSSSQLHPGSTRQNGEQPSPGSTSPKSQVSTGSTIPVPQVECWSLASHQGPCRPAGAAPSTTTWTGWASNRSTIRVAAPAVQASSVPPAAQASSQMETRPLKAACSSTRYRPFAGASKERITSRWPAAAPQLAPTLEA